MATGGLWLRGSVYFVNFVRSVFVEARRRPVEHEKGLLSVLLPTGTDELLLLYHMRSVSGGRNGNGTGAIRTTRFINMEFMPAAHREIIRQNPTSLPSASSEIHSGSPDPTERGGMREVSKRVRVAAMGPSQPGFLEFKVFCPHSTVQHCADSRG